jgi:hypothetical protein
MDAVPNRATDPDEYDIYLFELTAKATGIPAALEVNEYKGLLIIAGGWWQEEGSFYCERVTCQHCLN